MSILGKIKKAVVKTAKKALGVDNKPKAAKPIAEMGPSGSGIPQPSVARRRRGRARR